jgi:hypothetical protein
VSRNLNIPFDELKARMTGDEPMPLGRAIRELRPDLTEQSADQETKRAEEQAMQTEQGTETVG